jgi:hypothetical protein
MVLTTRSVAPPFGEKATSMAGETASTVAGSNREADNAAMAKEPAHGQGSAIHMSETSLFHRSATGLICSPPVAGVSDLTRPRRGQTPRAATTGSNSRAGSTRASGRGGRGGAVQAAHVL